MQQGNLITVSHFTDTVFFTSYSCSSITLKIVQAIQKTFRYHSFQAGTEFEGVKKYLTAARNIKLLPAASSKNKL